MVSERARDGHAQPRSSVHLVEEKRQTHRGIGQRKEHLLVCLELSRRDCPVLKDRENAPPRSQRSAELVFI